MDTIEKIEKAFCGYYCLCCDKCPISSYSIDRVLAYCYYAAKKTSTAQQKRLFLDAARKEWHRELSESSYIGPDELKLLFGKAAII